jgi:adenosylcobinamide-GDP ribazoletransferase
MKSVKMWVDAFWHAVAFLTRLPVPRGIAMDAWAKSPAWYPMVGAVIGGLLATLAWALGHVVPPVMVAVVTVTVWVYGTGGLHVDGLMDTADGFGSQREKERMLEIMKDSRVGAMGVLAAMLVLGNKVAALASLQGTDVLWGLVLAPVLGRGVMLVALWYFPYARASGLAQSLRSVGVFGRTIPFLFVCVVLVGSVWWLKWKVLLVVLLPILVAWRLLATAQRKIGGCTGDIYGALCELVEAAVLLAMAVSRNLHG